ncbi:MAG: 50S ribosomal protein L11 methyltransferase [Oscillospiraceae bacterium]|nr:50S ribosomal protein L11 methyltransferase [Oscillospiraceae bacterium]
MAWLEITINTAQKSVDEIAAILTANGFSDLLIEDQDQFEDFLEQNKAYWDYIDEALQHQLQGLSRIKLYLEETDTAALDRLTALVASLSLPMTVAPMADVNWEESWKDNYTAVEVGDRLVVLPYWLQSEEHPGRLPVILDPGLTFGTGAHPSTQMVLRAMEKYVKPGSHCLDLGSGSGILSIAALRLGAGSATGVDIDPKAEDIARENAAYNHFSAPQFTALTGNVTTDRKLMDTLAGKAYGIVLVNIVADVIIALAPVLPTFLGEESILICSGILDTRLQDVLSALTQAGLTVLDAYEQEDWRCVTAKRRTL